MITLRRFSDVRNAIHGEVALVPTMGYLHEGHLALIEHAASVAETIVVSLFVNPTQFGDAADLAGYPMDEARDAALAEASGADVLFAPAADEVYPTGPGAFVSVPGPSDGLEGEYRPGHFDGVATVVSKLLSGIQPDVACFGRKDAQQLAVIQALVRSLRIPTRVDAISTVREPDGLALSSRNTRLDSEARTRATVISRALFAASDLVETGERDAAVVVGAAASVLDGSRGVEVDYVTCVDDRTVLPVERIESDVFIAVAATVDGVRLIDNVAVDAATLRVDRGRILERPSILYEEV